DVAKVVDHGAKNIPAGFQLRHSRLPLAKAPIVRINYSVQKSRRRLIFMRQSPLARDHPPGGSHALPPQPAPPLADSAQCPATDRQHCPRIVAGIPGYCADLLARFPTVVNEQLAPVAQAIEQLAKPPVVAQPVPDIPPQSPL